MRLNCERDLLVRTSCESLHHFWMLLFSIDRLLDLRRISCSVLLFFFTKTLPLRRKLSVPSDFNNEISFLSFETLIWLIESSAGKMSDFTKRSLDSKHFSHIANFNSPIDLSIISLYFREFQVLKSRALKVN